MIIEKQNRKIKNIHYHKMISIEEFDTREEARQKALEYQKEVLLETNPAYSIQYENGKYVLYEQLIELGCVSRD